MNMSGPVVVPFSLHNCHHVQNTKGTARAKNVISCVVFVMPLLFIHMRMHNNRKTVAAISDVEISLFRLNESTMMHETFSSNTVFKRTHHWTVSRTTFASYYLRNACCMLRKFCLPWLIFGEKCKLKRSCVFDFLLILATACLLDVTIRHCTTPVCACVRVGVQVDHPHWTAG